jgi:hypothetical protein
MFFNITIETNNIFDIRLSNKKYTWCNNHVDPTFAKLDRFCSYFGLARSLPLDLCFAL